MYHNTSACACRGSLRISWRHCCPGSSVPSCMFFLESCWYNNGIGKYSKYRNLGRYLYPYLRQYYHNMVLHTKLVLCTSTEVLILSSTFILVIVDDYYIQTFYRRPKLRLFWAIDWFTPHRKADIVFIDDMVVKLVQLFWKIQCISWINKKRLKNR